MVKCAKLFEIGCRVLLLYYFLIRLKTKERILMRYGSNSVWNLTLCPVPAYFITAIRLQEKEINFFLKRKKSEDLEKDRRGKGTRSNVCSLSRLRRKFK